MQNICHKISVNFDFIDTEQYYLLYNYYRKDKIMSKYKYDIGISYASENEKYVSRVIKLLKELYNLEVFYAPEEQRKMIGEDLLIYLNRAYKDECRYVAIFISDPYLIKEYTRQEAAIIKVRQLHENYKFIIPVVFGNAKLDWLSDDIDYMSGDKSLESEVAYYINEKVKSCHNDCAETNTEKSNSTSAQSNTTFNFYGNGANFVSAENITNSTIQPRGYTDEKDNK